MNGPGKRKPAKEFNLQVTLSGSTGERQANALAALCRMMHRDLPTIAERLGVPLFVDGAVVPPRPGEAP